jgi:hypothetical protein
VGVIYSRRAGQSIVREGEGAMGITDMLSFLASFLNSHPAIGWKDGYSVSAAAQEGGDTLIMQKNPFGRVFDTVCS